jgi:hypothetical protein
MMKTLLIIIVAGAGVLAFLMALGMVIQKRLVKKADPIELAVEKVFPGSLARKWELSHIKRELSSSSRHMALMQALKDEICITEDVFEDLLRRIEIVSDTSAQFRKAATNVELIRWGLPRLKSGGWSSGDRVMLANWIRYGTHPEDLA